MRFSIPCLRFFFACMVVKSKQGILPLFLKRYVPQKIHPVSLGIRKDTYPLFFGRDTILPYLKDTSCIPWDTRIIKRFRKDTSNGYSFACMRKAHDCCRRQLWFTVSSSFVFCLTIHLDFVLNRTVSFYVSYLFFVFQKIRRDSSKRYTLVRIFWDL